MSSALLRSMTGFTRSLLSMALLTGAVSAQTLQPAVLLHYCPAPASAPPPAITCGGAIAQGIDGAMWFGYQMGAINPVGQIKTLPGLNCNGITGGPDGAMWFTHQSTQNSTLPVISRISASGVVTGYPVPVAGQQPSGATVLGITAGPDGALWFTDQGNADNSIESFDQIGRITVSGEVTMYPLPTLGSLPGTNGAITAGPDGNLWFAEVGGIGRITLTGVITEFPIPTEYGYPPVTVTSITTGPDGALWATAGSIVRVTTDGLITQYAVLGGYATGAITSGPNDSLWFFTSPGTVSSELNSVSTDGTFTNYGVEASGVVGGMATAPDGSLWFSEPYLIGQIIMQTATLTALPATPYPLGVSYPGSSLTVTGSGYAAGETVNLNANSTGANQLARATADSGGGFSVSLKVPELAISGRQTVVGVGATSGRIAVAPYTVSPLVWPSSTMVSPGSSITVSGVGFEPNELLSMSFNSNEVWKGQCDENGAFYGPTAVTFAIPENTAPGTYPLSVMGTYTKAPPSTRYITVQ